LAYVRSHGRACEVLGQEKPDHVAVEEMERRIEHLDDAV
jgi:hypothetical protein